MREVKIIKNVLYVKCNKCWRFLLKDCFYNSNRGARWIYCNCKDCRRKIVSKSVKKYPKKASKRNSLIQDQLSEKYGFSRRNFHIKAYRLAKKIGYPIICPICWNKNKIQIHHPSYNKFEDRSKVIFCCSDCHQKIHQNKIHISNFIDLIKLKNG